MMKKNNSLLILLFNYHFCIFLIFIVSFISRSSHFYLFVDSSNFYGIIEEELSSSIKTKKVKSQFDTLNSDVSLKCYYENNSLEFLLGKWEGELNRINPLMKSRITLDIKGIDSSSFSGTFTRIDMDTLEALLVGLSKNDSIFWSLREKTDDEVTELFFSPPPLYSDSILTGLYFDERATNFNGSFELQKICSYPITDFEFNTSTKEGEVKFENTTRNESISQVWNFGDNEGSFERNPTHDYKSNGNYQVTLIAINECGADTAQKLIIIEDFCESNNNIASKNPCRARDSLALVDLYYATHGNGVWINEWDLSSPITCWFGVELNSDGCVTCLDLDGTPNCSFINDPNPGNNLSGVLPAKIGQLTELTTLSLYGNKLTSSLPDTMRNLKKLEKLFLTDNNFTGNIPTWIGGFSEMVSLWLHRNEFDGEIPSSLKNLSNLEQLYLDGNNLKGEIPEGLGDLLKIKRFSLSRNFLTGTIPSSFSNLQNLERFYIDDNFISGSIPFSFNNFTELEDVEIEKNQFTFSDLLNTFNGITDNIANNSTANWQEYTYTPQKFFYKDTILTIFEGENLIIDLKIDEGLKSNLYKWSKDGRLLTSIEESNFLTLANASQEDEGIYQVEVTNENIPLLTLTSQLIEVRVEELEEGAIIICANNAKKRIPQSFAPNSTLDNNRTFDPLAPLIDCLINSKVDLTIFNRYGNIIYQPIPYEPWDGTIYGNGTPAEPTTYYYTLKIGEGKDNLIKGAINLIAIE